MRPIARHAKQGSTESAASTKNELAARQVMGDAERELYQFELPDGERGFGDLLDTYKPGQRFQFVALTGRDEESVEARVRRLVTLQPRVNKSAIAVDKIPKLRLIEDAEQFALAEAIPVKGKDYIRLASITIIFIPLNSAMSGFTKAKISLLDTRYTGSQVVQSVKFSTNVPMKQEMSMDYCIPRQSASKIILMISREQATMEMGEQWGACQLMLAIEQSDFPYANNFKEVAAVAAIPPAVLGDYEVNPNHLDVGILENHRKKLREMFENGDIADETEPIQNKTAAIQYSKSTMPTKKGAKAESSGLVRAGWEHMSNMRKPLIPEDQVSQDPSQDGMSDLSSVPMEEGVHTPPVLKGPVRSAMKKQVPGVGEAGPVKPMESGALVLAEKPTADEADDDDGDEKMEVLKPRGAVRFSTGDV